MNKKILIITPKFYPSIGGIEEQVKLLGINFTEKGYKVDILTNKYENPLKNKETLFGLNIFRFSNILFYISFLVKNKNYELIISRQYYKNSFILGLLKFLKLINLKTIICTDSGGNDDEINTIKNKLLFLNIYKIYYFFIGKNNYLNCLNKENKDHLINIYNGKEKYIRKFSYIYNGININGFNNSKISKIKNILFLGRFEKQKGIFETIEAFKLTNNNITFHIVGYGEKNIETELLDKIKNDNRIIFHGKLYGEKKEKIIKNTDLFIFPTYYPEGQPVTITEITIHNIPIITTDVANIKEIFGNNVIYVKKENIEDLKNKIEWIIDNIKDYKYNYKNVLKKIDINNITEQFLNLK